MNLSALFGTPEEAQARLEKITDSPDVFLLNYLFGFNGTADEGALNYAVSFELDKKFEVKQAALSASYQTVNYSESDRIGSYDKSKYSAQVDVKVPKKNPKLTNLKGIKGYTPPTPSEAPDYGKRPKIGTYQSKPQKLTLNLEWLEPAEDVQGNSRGERNIQLEGTVYSLVEVTETRLNIKAVFTAADDASVVFTQNFEYELIRSHYYFSTRSAFSTVTYKGGYWSAGVAHELRYGTDECRVRIGNGKYFDVPMVKWL